MPKQLSPGDAATDFTTTATEFASVTEVRDWFRNELVAGIPFPDASRELLKILREPDQWCNLLRAYADDEEALTRNCSECYFHVNGFDRLVLLNELDFRLRFHVWSADKRSPYKEGVHNHTWFFVSALLEGALVAETFVPDETAEGEYYYYRSVLPDKDLSYRYEFVKRAGLRKLIDIEMTPGTVYFLSHDVLHRVWLSSEGYASTIVLTGPYLCPDSDVYTYAPIDLERQETVDRYTPEDVRALLLCWADRKESEHRVAAPVT